MASWKCELHAAGRRYEANRSFDANNYAAPYYRYLYNLDGCWQEMQE